MGQELVKPDDRTNEMQLASDASPITRIIELIGQGAEIDTNQIEKIIELNERHEANEARKAFHVAMAEFKKDPPEIIKDKLNTQYGSNYSSLANVTSTISTALSEHGLSATWKPDQKDGQIYVTCFLTHRLGHSEETTLFAPPDGSGSKNPIQQIKSTISYLEQITLLAAVGLATNDMGDDGNGAGGNVPGKAPIEIGPPNEKETATLQVIADLIPPKAGFVVSIKKIGSLCYSSYNEYPRNTKTANAIAEWITGNYLDSQYYDEID